MICGRHCLGLGTETTNTLWLTVKFSPTHQAILGCKPLCVVVPLDHTQEKKKKKMEKATQKEATCQLNLE